MFSTGHSSLYFAPKTKEKMYFIWLSTYLARKYYLRKPFLHFCTRDWTCKRNLIPESGKFLLVESGIWSLKSGIQLKESGIPLTIGIQTPEFHWQRLESSTCSPESTASNLESRIQISRIHKWKRFSHLHGASSSHTSVWRSKAVPLFLSSCNIVISVSDCQRHECNDWGFDNQCSSQHQSQ